MVVEAMHRMFGEGGALPPEAPTLGVPDPCVARGDGIDEQVRADFVAWRRVSTGRGFWR